MLYLVDIFKKYQYFNFTIAYYLGLLVLAGIILFMALY
jgi:hypothetical protein